MVALLVIAIFVFGLVMLIGAQLRPILRHIWYGEWGIEPVTGEARRVIYRNHHGVYLDSRSHDQQTADAAFLRQSRLKELATSLVAFAVSAAILVYFNSHRVPLFYAHERGAGYLLGALMTGVLVVFIGIFFVVGGCLVLWEGYHEALYLSEYQRWKGAKVITLPPGPPLGPQAVYDQKIYGSDTFVTPEEADAAYGGKSGSSHSQPIFKD
jgi:hypothetical protein